MKKDIEEAMKAYEIREDAENKTIENIYNMCYSSIKLYLQEG